MKSRKTNWKNYLLEFLSIFIGISMAFALNKWNDDRKRDRSREKILIEIRNGLEQDLQDLRGNVRAHRLALDACDYFRDLLADRPVAQDSFDFKYFILLRGLVSIQNQSGYEALKANGLDLVKNDSLRQKIVSLYDFHYEVIEKLEERYGEMQYSANYYHPINAILAKHLIFSPEGRILGFRAPLRLRREESNLILGYLGRLEFNRRYTLDQYATVEERVMELIELIGEEVR